MVRETRHLWVGNLPDNIREDRIREHFKRYGRVQNVKLLGRAEGPGAVTSGPTNTACGVCATVAFMDIKSASKAHTADHVLDERTLTTEYYEPAAIPSAATGAPSAGSSPAGSGYSGSSSSVNSAPAPTPPTRYLLSGGEESTGPTCPAATAAAPANWRGTNDSATTEFCRRGNTPAAYGRYQRNNSAPYSTPPSNVERTPLHRWYGGGSVGGGESTPSTPGAEAGTRRRRRSGSGSSRSDSSSPDPSDESRCSSPAAAAGGANNATSSHHRTGQPHQWASTASGRPLAICVRNLPTRSTDSSLKDGLYHEYKKHGKVVWVKVVGQNADRYAIVRFKKPSDVEKALEVSQDKLFFGCKISVAPHQSCEEDAESAKPYETDIDEYHPKATRTLFIGNLEKDVTQQMLRDKFKHYGRIIEIDIKKGSGGGAGYAFCQYASISSVVEAIRAMDGEHVGSSRVKLGFGKPVATTCVFVDGLTEHTEKQVLGAVSRCGAATSVCVDRAAGAALIHFEQACAASAAVRELRRVAAHASAGAGSGPADAPDQRLCVDYASRECQEQFYEQLEKHGGNTSTAGSERIISGGDLSSRYMPPTRHDTLRSRASSYSRSTSRTPRYSTVDHYDSADYGPERRYRVYDELGSSPHTEDTPYEEKLQSVVVSPHRSRRHRRDSSPEDHKHSKQEWHRSVSSTRGVVVSVGRSRSGSRRRHRRRREDGTPLRDEPDAPPAEPRRPPGPRDRSHLPMSLPLPKFAVLLRNAGVAAPPPQPAPPPAPASPARPRSTSSSSAGSAPHSPSLEERIRSLDEKYERWSRPEGVASAPAPAAGPAAPPPVRHRLLKVDIHEVKPSDVVRSLLAKRSVFDEDSERLEGSQRPPSPSACPAAATARPRPLQYPFPSHADAPPNGLALKLARDFPDAFIKSERKSVDSPNLIKSADFESSMRTPCRSETADKSSDPRLNRVDRSISTERLLPSTESDRRYEGQIRIRTPSTDKLAIEMSDKISPKLEKDSSFDRERPLEIERDRRRLSVYSDKECDRPLEPNKKDDKTKCDSGISSIDFMDRDNVQQEVKVKIERSDTFDCHSIKSLSASLIEGTSRNYGDKHLLMDNKMSNKNKKTQDKYYSQKTPDKIFQKKSEDKVQTTTKDDQQASMTLANIKVENVIPDITQATIDEEIAEICKFHSSQDDTTNLLDLHITDDTKQSVQQKSEPTNEVIGNHIKDAKKYDDEKNKLDTTKKIKTENFDVKHDFLKACDKNGKERFISSAVIAALHSSKIEKENIELEKSDKDRLSTLNYTSTEKRNVSSDKNLDDRLKSDREKVRNNKGDKNEYEKERVRSTRHDKEKRKEESEKLEKEKKREDFQDKLDKDKRKEDVPEKTDTDRGREDIVENSDKDKRRENSSEKLAKDKRREDISEKNDKERRREEHCDKIDKRKEDVIEKIDKDKRKEEFSDKSDKDKLKEDHLEKTDKNKRKEDQYEKTDKDKRKEDHYEKMDSKDKRKDPFEKADKDKKREDQCDNIDKEKRTEDLYEKPEKRTKDDGFFDSLHTRVKYDKQEKESKSEKDTEKSYKDKSERDMEKSHKHIDEKISRHDHHRKDRYDKRKDSIETNDNKTKKEDKHKHDRHRKDHGDSKRDGKKESDSKIRKTSRDESNRDLCRKDSTDSSTSRASYDSSKLKEFDSQNIKDELKTKSKSSNDYSKHKSDKEPSPKVSERMKVEETVKIKSEIKEEKVHPEQHTKRSDFLAEHQSKIKAEPSEKHRHYSVDSPGLDSKRKERLNSCSSLPSHIGHKRRMSSQDSLDSISDENKRLKYESNVSDRRDSKDSRNTERHKGPKFNKNHFARILESKTKDEKKNQVKTPDDILQESKDESKDKHSIDKIKFPKKSPIYDTESGKLNISDIKTESLQNDLDFLETLKLEARSEEDEKQKALRREMKEKKRLQQLQQIQELQLQQDAMQQADYINKIKEEKKNKADEKRKEAAREKRMSTDRKSRDEKCDKQCDGKRRSRKAGNSNSDTSDSDEPKKHSIFDIVDDGPTYISMYDKVKARSCKNMQKQEEEKRQEKIKAKFSQLKQSRAKREEKKRSSWDEDSDSEQDRKKSQKNSMDSSSEDDHDIHHNDIRDRLHESAFEFDHSKKSDYLNTEDESNKLSRKNSRSRIMSDTSDDDTLKRLLAKSPSFTRVKKEKFSNMFSDSESVQSSGFFSKADTDILAKDCGNDRTKKNSLLNLFGKSDSDDSKIKSYPGENHNDYKPTFIKKCNDFSSGSESLVSNIYSGEVRKKHKKKQKRNKFSLSEEEAKINDFGTDSDVKHRHEKSRRHGSKKEKRRDKIRDSVDTDESRDERVKLKNKTLLKPPVDNMENSLGNIKKDGKMEDIFGPLSDDSDSTPSPIIIPEDKTEFTSNDFNSNFGMSNQHNKLININEIKSKEKEENRRRKEKRRKDKRHFSKEDENSLDVDAVSKAIEARLFADPIPDDDKRSKLETLSKSISKHDFSNFAYKERSSIDFGDDKKIHDKTRRDNKEKRKKKKRSREERSNRKEHHHFHHHDKLNIQQEFDLKPDLFTSELPQKDLQENKIFEEVHKQLDNKDNTSPSSSPCLPRLTASPPMANNKFDSDAKNLSSDLSGELTIVEDVEITFDEKKEVVIDNNDNSQSDSAVEIVQEVPSVSDKSNAENVSSFDTDNDQGSSEDAVRSISNLPNDTTQNTDAIDAKTTKVEEKIEEKPRAVISQEETADAVAALLGESFGGNVTAFDFEDGENSTNQIESSTVENQNMPEEDAEEMRRAVQNLNASEMEMKPDTPMSDNDLLLIDTDTEEADETPQDAIDRLPVNIIATNPTLNPSTDQLSKAIVTKPKSSLPAVTQSQASIPASATIKLNEKEIKLSPGKREVLHPNTSTPTPVITSWTLSGNKLREPQLINISKAQVISREPIDSKAVNVTASIIQLKTQAGHAIQTSAGASVRPIMTTPNRMGTPYQVINHQMLRAQIPNMQPPTIKIPEPQILYQKQQNIVLSPRMTIDQRMQSPKGMTQGEPMTSPRLATNMTILSTSPQNLNAVGITSPNNMPQRSPSHVTVVRVQQPPLSPIQAMHLPPGARSMVSPNRSNSVLVQTQGTPIHFNRLPMAPVLAPISKQLNANTLLQQNKGIGVVTTPLIHPQKNMPTDCRPKEQRSIGETTAETSKIILSTPTNLQQNQNTTAMTQNRLISMQSAIHVGNINSPLKLSNKVLINTVNSIGERKDNSNLQLKSDMKKPEHLPFGSSPIIQVNHSSGHIIHSTGKPIMIHEQNPSSREQGSNVIHTINSPRLITTAPISNVIQIDANKVPPSVLSMSTIRSPTVLTKLESSTPVVTTTSTLSNVVMTPLLLKTTSSALGTVRMNNKHETENHASVLQQNHQTLREEKFDDISNKTSVGFDSIDNRKELLIKPVKPPTPLSEMSKCETDFEELLKHNTNEIKITKVPEKKLEVNVGKSASLVITSVHDHDNVSAESSGFVRDTDLSNKEENKIIQEATSEKPVDDKFKGFSSEPKEFNTNPKKETPKMIHLVEQVPLVTDKSSDGAISKDDDKPLAALLSEQSDDDKKHIDESDSWSAKDLNIESVIKKVDSLCNDNIEETDVRESTLAAMDISPKSDVLLQTSDLIKHLEVNNRNPNDKGEFDPTEEISSEKGNASKRGGRNMRGKKFNKNQEKVQIKTISKPARGGGAKRGRGRANVDKKIKNAINASANNLPGDVYDFHEDSGDEAENSINKSESRPRLILTIKSPLSGQSTAVTSSCLTITPKPELVKPPEKNPILDKDEKNDEFVSPSASNTRKSRRLQEKDVSRNVEDVIEDVVKGTPIQTRGVKDTPKRRGTRQAGPKATNQEKITDSDARKSPRGAKRTRDRSLSNASTDSSDEKLVTKKEEGTKEAKLVKLSESITPVIKPATPAPPPPPPKVDPEPQPVIKTNPPIINTMPAATPTPIMKPPKKMISEISAKLASAFEAAASSGPIKTTGSPLVAEKIVESGSSSSKLAAEADELMPYREASNPECGIAIGEDVMTAEARTDAGFRRLMDAPVGALEAADARVQSPALPHRPPSIPSVHRPADRATPVLMRGGEGNAAPCGYRAVYAGTASLPRGAHHPPPPPPQHLLKPLVAAAASHHHPLTGSTARMNVTSVPNVSPQGQIPLSTDSVRSPPPAHQQTSPVTPGEGMYPHFSRQHYQMYQHHFHATQHENRASPSPYTRSLEAEGSEAPTPPLELRRPPSARVPRPAHSPAAPADRLIMYGVVGGRSPPPAHATRPPSALPPPGPSGPPHASQVPREADSLQMLLQRYPVMWQGLLALKNDSAAVQMHFVGGNPGVAGNTLPRHTDGSTPPLRIAQRMRLEPQQLDQVHRKMKMEAEHCILLALPCGRDHMDVLQQSTNLTGGFITYLQRKQAAGIVNVAPPGHRQAMFTVHIFPSCDFANENLNRIAPDLMHRVADIAHLLIVIATV